MNTATLDQSQNIFKLDPFAKSCQASDAPNLARVAWLGKVCWRCLFAVRVARPSHAWQRGANALRAIFAKRRSACPARLELALTSHRQQLDAQPEPTLRQETRTERNKARRICQPLGFWALLLLLFGVVAVIERYLLDITIFKKILRLRRACAEHASRARAIKSAGLRHQCLHATAPSVSRVWLSGGATRHNPSRPAVVLPRQVVVLQLLLILR